MNITSLPMYKRARKGVGYLSQEPELDPEKDVFGNILEGMQETHILLKQFEEVIRIQPQPTLVS